jgi:hypothetical protein
VFLDPEQLDLPEVTFQQGLPVLTWTYTLSPYGQQRFDAAVRHNAEDWSLGALHTALTLGAIAVLSLSIVAFAFNQELLWWQYLHWLVGLWVAGVAAAYLHVQLGYRVENPFPLRYQLRLTPDPSVRPTPAQTGLLLSLHLDGDARPPPEHALPILLGSLDTLVLFEVLKPELTDRFKRHQLLAYLGNDKHGPRRTVLIASWRDGELEAGKAQSPLQALHEQLSWALLRNKDDGWRKLYTQRRLASPV